MQLQGIEDEVIPDLGDKEMIRKEFPTVVSYDDLQVGLTDVGDHNILIFGIISLSDRILSYHGGFAVVSSYFVGNDTKSIRARPELLSWDYNYFHPFSITHVQWKNNDNTYSWRTIGTFNQTQTKKNF